MTDIKHTEQGDIDFTSGDIRYETSDRQHQKDILVSQKGYWKEHPEVGVDISAFVNETEPENMLRTIKKEFAGDGMKISKVRLSDTGIIETDATYENR